MATTEPVVIVTPRGALTQRAAGTWAAPSQSSQGKSWTVRADATGYTCDCPAATHNRTCWHVAALISAAKALLPEVPTPEPAECSRCKGTGIVRNALYECAYPCPTCRR